MRKVEVFLSRPASKLEFATYVCLSVIMCFISGCGQDQLGPIVIGATSDTVRIGETDTLTATQGPVTLTGGRWIVIGDASNGQIGQDGIFHTPNAIPEQNPVQVAYSLNSKNYIHEIQILNPVPVVNSVSPSVLRAATNAVSVVGSKFVPGATVVVNGQATQTSFIDSSHLTAVVAVSSTGSPLSVAVNNPGPGENRSSSLPITVSFSSFTVSPSILTGGPVTITITGSDIEPDMVVTLDGKQLDSTTSNSQITATGYLLPWRSGSVPLSVSSKGAPTPSFEIQLPIASPIVSFDVAARFLMQAGFGPRPDLVAHIQKVGLDAFITEQQATIVAPYSSTDPGMMAPMARAVLGSTPLRMRIAWALQSFLVRSGIFLQQSNFPFQTKMEIDSTRNFRDVLDDVSLDVSMGLFLNLIGNSSPMDPTVHPNQNFARELLQLFTIGTVMLNDDGTIQTSTDGTPIPAYDQDTILAVSRALTGWNSPTPKDPNYTFYGIDWSRNLEADESQHDHTQKVMFGNIVLRAGQSASQDRTMALDAIFAHPNLPPFVSRILIQRLVKSNPSPDYVRRIANVFKADQQGVRGNLAAVTRAILLDPEARAGDTSPTPSDGFLQEPYLFQTFLMSMTGWAPSDSQPSYIPCSLNECTYYPSTVFGFFSPSFVIPGTQINSPEFQIVNNITLINRSQVLWGMVTGQQPGFGRVNSAWLYTNFHTVPEFVEALNHIAYHGQMPQQEQDYITNYCSTAKSDDPLFPSECVIFLALNDDNYAVTH